MIIDKNDGAVSGVDFVAEENVHMGSTSINHRLIRLAYISEPNLRPTATLNAPDAEMGTT